MPSLVIKFNAAASLLQVAIVYFFPQKSNGCSYKSGDLSISVHYVCSELAPVENPFISRDTRAVGS